MSIKNGKITHFFLGFEDHGIFTYNIRIQCDVNYGFGGICLFNLNKRNGDLTGQVVARLLKVLQVGSVLGIEGQYCRLAINNETCTPEYIGHICDTDFMNANGEHFGYGHVVREVGI